MKPMNEIYFSLLKKTKLHCPNLNEPFCLNTDACDIVIGAILYQTNGIIGHFSKKLNKSRKKYSTTEKEMFAILMAVRYWEGWIGGSKIVVLMTSKIYLEILKIEEKN